MKSSLIYEVTGLLFPILQECLYIYYNKEYNYEYKTVEWRWTQWIMYGMWLQMRWEDTDTRIAVYSEQNLKLITIILLVVLVLVIVLLILLMLLLLLIEPFHLLPPPSSTTSFSSIFQKLVVSGMLSLQNDYLYTAIHDITGRTNNYNYSHIYLTHYALLNTHSQSFPCGLNKNREVELIPILLYKQKTTRLIRNIEDSKYLAKPTNITNTPATTTT